MISFKYLPAVCVLAALAIVPTIIHSYSDAAIDDGLDVDGIAEVLDDATSVRTDRSATWGRRRFDTDDWIEREYRNMATGKRLTLTVVRSLDAKSVYHHPELAVADGIAFVGLDVRRFEDRPEIAVYVMRRGPGVQTGAMYALHYADAFVENPILFQLKNAGELLLSRRKPMTLFFVVDQDARDGDAAAARLLFAAVDSFIATASVKLTP